MASAHAAHRGRGHQDVIYEKCKERPGYDDSYAVGNALNKVGESRIDIALSLIHIYILKREGYTIAGEASGIDP